MRFSLLTLTLASLALQARAELKLPAIFGDHMVLQQKQANPVWGWDTPGTEVTVQFAGQTQSAKAGADGKWTVKLAPLPANAKPATLTIRGTSQRELKDVLVGEVWVCSGQSNMQWSVLSSWDADLEIATAKYPNIRLISVPQVGTQEPQDDFKGAVGFFYGRVLHQMLDVPVGLINNAWGGSAAEAWVRRDLLEKDARYKTLIEGWVVREKQLSSEQAQAAHEKALADWKAKAAAARQAGKPFTVRAPQSPQQILGGQHRPGNLFNGVLRPTIGYGIRGVIWYQGESNASRAHEHGYLFPMMNQHWRQEWGQGDFPFYWVQLADFKAEQPQPAESDWAELREAQTMTMKALPQTGEAVIIDIGEGKDIHPKNKQDVAKRLARWALAETYRVPGIACRSPLYKAMEKQGAKIVLAFDHVDGGWRPFDVPEPIGFTIAGADRKFVPAKGAILPDGRIEVSAEGVADPVAVRYAWSNAPDANLFNGAGLPALPFRSDDW